MIRSRLIALGIGLAAVAFAGGHYVGGGFSASDRISTEEFRRALSSRDWIWRARIVSGYVDALGPENLPEALEVIEDRRRWLSQDELRLIMIAWARFDAPAAFARTLTWPDHTRNKGAAAVIYGWALNDPIAAREALLSVGDSTLRALLIDRMVAAWAHGGDWGGVTRYISDLPDDPSRQRLLGVLIREILSDGHASVMEWVEGIPAEAPEGFKATAFERAAGILGQDDHEMAIAFVERNRHHPWAAGGPAAVARRWANKDPISALDWVEQLPAGVGRDRAIEIAFRQWQKSSPIAAEEWLASAEAGRPLDPARVLVVRQLATTSPAAALEFAEEISDLKLREESVVVALIHWLRGDREAASKWLEEHPLSDSVRKKIRARARGGAGREGRFPGAAPKRREAAD